MTTIQTNKITHFHGLGLRLREEREKLRLSQAEVADELGLSQTVVSQIERGKRNASDNECSVLDRLFPDIFPKNNVAQDWTQERLDQLKRLRASGMTTRGIAKQLGITAGAVAGKISRLGLTNPPLVNGGAEPPSTTPNPFAVDPARNAKPTAKTAAEICAAIDRIVDSVEVLGDTPELGSAIERLIEAGMWIDRHSRRTER